MQSLAVRALWQSSGDAVDPSRVVNLLWIHIFCSSLSERMIWPDER